MNFTRQQLCEDARPHWKSMLKRKSNCNNDIFINIFGLFQRFDKRWRIRSSACCESSLDDELNNNLDKDFDNDMRSHIKSIRT